MKTEQSNRFDKLLQVRVPGVLSIAIDAAAVQHFQSKSDYIRAGVIDRLKADGIDPARLVEVSQ